MKAGILKINAMGYTALHWLGLPKTVQFGK